MQSNRHFITLPLAVVLLACFSFASTAAEKDELALVIRQLEHAQAALERARVSAVQDSQQARFYFDYKRANEEINLIKQGITEYLNPTRSQPANTKPLNGQYQKER